ncbi:class C sortase, partial [Enterococcus faecium]|nr:class C sortase [Enterococcus faecium]
AKNRKSISLDWRLALLFAFFAFLLFLFIKKIRRRSE